VQSFGSLNNPSVVHLKVVEVFVVEIVGLVVVLVVVRNLVVVLNVGSLVIVDDDRVVVVVVVEGIEFPSKIRDTVEINGSFPSPQIPS
jgi:hypothetical protein